MNKRGWSWQTVLRYSLIQLPGLVMLVLILILLGYWVNIPMWAVSTIIMLWVIKDMILFPFVWRAYDKSDTNYMIGLRGMAADRLSPSGYVSIKGELWRAKVIEGDSVIEKGEIIRVIDMRGLTLIVQSDKKEQI